MSRLYVGNLNPGITKEKLGDAFNRFGPILEIWYNPDSGYAFVEFESQRDAQSAIRRMNKRRFHGVDLRVEPTKYRKKEYRAADEFKSGRRLDEPRFSDRRVLKPYKDMPRRSPPPVYRKATCQPDSDDDDDDPLPRYAPRPDRRYFRPPGGSPSPGRSPSPGGASTSSAGKFDPSKPLTIKSNVSAPRPSPSLPMYRRKASSPGPRVRVSDYRQRSFGGSHGNGGDSNAYHSRGSPSRYRTRSRSPPRGRPRVYSRSPPHRRR